MTSESWRKEDMPVCKHCMRLGAALVAIVTMLGNVAAAETRKLAAFDSIHVGVPADVVLQQGRFHEARILAEPAVERAITTRVHNGVLIIVAPNGFVSHRPVHIVVSASRLSTINVSAPATLSVESIQAEHGKVTVNSAAQVKIQNILGDTLVVQLSGAAALTVSGKINSLDAEVSDAGTLDAVNLVVSTCKVAASGASNLTVKCATNLDATAKGASTVSFFGSPRVTSTTDGTGKIVQKR